MSRRGTNIRKRTDGRWEGRYYIVDTAGSKKCKSVYGHSYKEVTERLLTAKAASLNQTAAPKQPAITVKAVAEKWLESIATSRKCSTIQKYSTIYNKYIKPNWGESVIDELNQNEILKELPETAGESITRKKSSSGGFATALSKAFVKNGGIVCSCTFLEGDFVFIKFHQDGEKRNKNEK